MKWKTSIAAAALVFMAAGTAQALYSVTAQGAWPKTWPKELETLRKQSKTYVGPTVLFQHHAIPFTDRAQFEAAWPHLLKVKSAGAPIILVSKNKRSSFFGVKPAGVLIQSPPKGMDPKKNPPLPVEGLDNPFTKWKNTTFIQLVVDGNVVDLNRLKLPADTPIIDQREMKESVQDADE